MEPVRQHVLVQLNQLRDWLHAHGWRAPTRCSDDAAERKAALCAAKLQMRCSRALGDGRHPRDQKLNATEVRDFRQLYSRCTPHAVAQSDHVDDAATEVDLVAAESVDAEISSQDDGEERAQVPQGLVVRSIGALVSLCLPGLNIQWPFSRLILAGAKLKEVRAYELGHRSIARANAEAWIVETPGPTAKALKHALAEDVSDNTRPEVAQIVGTVIFSHSVPYESPAAFRADWARHRIRQGSKYDWSGEGERHAWHISAVRALAWPVAVGSTGQTGFSKPRSFEVVFAEVPGARAANATHSSDQLPLSVAASSSTGAVADGGVQGDRPSRRQGALTVEGFQGARPSRRRRRPSELQHHAASLVPELLRRGGEGDDVADAGAQARALGSKRRRLTAKTSSSIVNAPGGENGGDAVQEGSAPGAPGAQEENGAACEQYFEAQVGAWCGMHALNNYMGGPYVTQDACRRAARRVVATLSEAGLGDSEDSSHHLDPTTGFLSIDVMNVLGAGTLGIHVEESAVAWHYLQAVPGGAAMVNWNNHHWTVLQREVASDRWVHSNSILGDAQRHGRAMFAQTRDVDNLLAEIQETYGGVTLHQITRAARDEGHHFLEREGLRAMVGPEDEEPADNVAGDANVPNPGAAPISATLSLVTVNVDGIGEYTATPAERMEDILNHVLVATPDVLLLQEVVAEMYRVVKRRLADWTIHRRHDIAEDYFNVTVVRTAPAPGYDKTTSYAFPTSNNGRHLVTVRRGTWTISNVHAESGGRDAERDARVAQLQYMSRIPEHEPGQDCVLAGDFNARAGEDLCLQTEGWRDVGRDARAVDAEMQDEWTWKRGENSARYDRVYTYGAHRGGCAWGVGRVNRSCGFARGAARRGAPKSNQGRWLWKWAGGKPTAARTRVWRSRLCVQGDRLSRRRGRWRARLGRRARPSRGHRSHARHQNRECHRACRPALPGTRGRVPAPIRRGCGRCRGTAAMGGGADSGWVQGNSSWQSKGRATRSDCH